jgi:hypothetical protein
VRQAGCDRSARGDRRLGVIAMMLTGANDDASSSEAVRYSRSTGGPPSRGRRAVPGSNPHHGANCMRMRGEVDLLAKQQLAVEVMQRDGGAARASSLRDGGRRHQGQPGYRQRGDRTAAQHCCARQILSRVSSCGLVARCFR